MGRARYTKFRTLPLTEVAPECSAETVAARLPYVAPSTSAEYELSDDAIVDQAAQGSLFSLTCEEPACLI